MTRPVSPHCTDFCTGGGQALGHPVTTWAEEQLMISALAAHGIPYVNGIPDEFLVRAIKGLYEKGFGYNAAADLARISHERANRILMTGADPG